jgi:hypothetical protein
MRKPQPASGNSTSKQNKSYGEKNNGYIVYNVFTFNNTNFFINKIQSYLNLEKVKYTNLETSSK